MAASSKKRRELLAQQGFEKETGVRGRSLCTARTGMPSQVTGTKPLTLCHQSILRSQERCLWPREAASCSPQLLQPGAQSVIVLLPDPYSLSAAQGCPRPDEAAPEPIWHDSSGVAASGSPRRQADWVAQQAGPSTVLPGHQASLPHMAATVSGNRSVRMHGSWEGP